jgi:dTDP-4-dehydrorhamnose reductase
LKNTQQNILVTGANGQLGNEFNAIAQNYPHFNFIFVTKAQMPIDDFKVVELYFEKNKIDFCINCAAYTAVDKAETETEKAFLINADAIGNLALICKKHHTQFIHISTDYVFDGSASTLINEIQTTNPLGVYGASKLKGEQLALQNNKHCIIIRTSWVYSFFGNNFVKTMLRLMKEKESINVVNDQIGKPTYAKDLANAIMQIIEKNNLKKSSIYHFSNDAEPMSWYNFATIIKEISKSNCVVNPITTAEYPTAAKRPMYTAFDTTKIENEFNLVIPNWKDSLQKCIHLLN